MTQFWRNSSAIVDSPYNSDKRKQFSIYSYQVKKINNWALSDKLNYWFIAFTLTINCHNWACNNNSFYGTLSLRTCFKNIFCSLYCWSNDFHFISWIFCWKRWSHMKHISAIFNSSERWSKSNTLLSTEILKSSFLLIYYYDECYFFPFFSLFIWIYSLCALWRIWIYLYRYLHLISFQLFIIISLDIVKL